jgi:hypothetical protein
MNLPDQPMNADELRGFNIACACMVRWGRQIERNGISLGGDTDTVPRRDMMRHGGKMVRGCAEAMALTLGNPDRSAHSQVLELAPARLKIAS